MNIHVNDFMIEEAYQAIIQAKSNQMTCLLAKQFETAALWDKLLAQRIEYLRTLENDRKKQYNDAQQRSRLNQNHESQMEQGAQNSKPRRIV